MYLCPYSPGPTGFLFFLPSNPLFAQPLSDFDLEARERNERILAEAQRKLEEEEDEIKKLNDMIAQAKIYAVRDAQLAEKAQLAASRQQEERRIAEQMERDRIEALRKQEEHDALVRAQREEGAHMVHEQVRCRLFVLHRKWRIL